MVSFGNGSLAVPAPGFLFGQRNKMFPERTGPFGWHLDPICRLKIQKIIF